MLPTKLRSERCANDLNHFQLKVPSGTFSIAEICLTQRGQASVTLQPNSGLFNLLGAGVVKLTTMKMDKTKQFNSLSFTFLFNQLQSTTLECCFAQFLPVLKQNAHIIAVKLS